jgi:hypothetical protein
MSEAMLTSSIPTNLELWMHAKLVDRSHILGDSALRMRSGV